MNSEHIKVDNVSNGSRALGFVMRDCTRKSPGFTNQRTAFHGKFCCHSYFVDFCIINGVAATYFLFLLVHYYNSFVMF